MPAPLVVPSGPMPLDLPVRALTGASWLQAIIGYAPIKALLPIPILFAVAPPIWWFFRDTWRELDAEAAAYRAELAARGRVDYRPYVVFLIVGAVLTMQEYYGARPFYEEVLREPLQHYSETHVWLKVQKYDELFGYWWWALSRFIG